MNNTFFVFPNALELSDRIIALRRNQRERLCNFRISAGAIVAAPRAVQFDEQGDNSVVVLSSRGAVVAFIDAIIAVCGSDRQWKVLLAQHLPDEPFPEKWWFPRGQVKPYSDPLDDIIAYAGRELGIPLDRSALIPVAVSYTSCATLFVSSMQPSFLALIDGDPSLGAGFADDWPPRRLFSLEEYTALPIRERHWYVTEVLEAAFKAFHLARL